ncbi:hypothetical protein R1sor_021014 [Riccia sorocarpa]|uniref:DUF4283 domain-containing protein n=1 Tax=Riccia sorocarpa TaxID=122646 RepID=A0ABD3GFU1_9MARC
MDFHFNPADITFSRVTMWVELPYVHPGVESFGKTLLEKIGKVVHYDQNEQWRHHNIKGHLLLDLQEELSDTLVIEDEETESDKKSTAYPGPKQTETHQPSPKVIGTKENKVVDGVA